LPDENRRSSIRRTDGTQKRLVLDEEKLAILKRQIESKCSSTGASAQTGEETSFSRLISLASSSDRIYLYIGVFAAIITGCGLPSFSFIFGNVVDAFGTQTPE